MILAFWTEKIGESHRVDLIRFDGFTTNLAEDLETFGGRVWSWEGREDFSWLVGDLEGHYVYIWGGMDLEKDMDGKLHDGRSQKLGKKTGVEARIETSFIIISRRRRRPLAGRTIRHHVIAGYTL